MSPGALFGRVVTYIGMALLLDAASHALLPEWWSMQTMTRGDAVRLAMCALFAGLIAREVT